MFKNNKTQFVNILKQDKQLKVDYRVFDENKLIKKDTSSFLNEEDTLSKDIISKLNILQNDITKTFLTTLISIPDQEIKLTGDIDTSVYECVALDGNCSVAISKNDILSYSSSFTKTGIDYIVSPFSLLYKHISNKVQKNSLNILIHDNKLYLLISDKNNNFAKGAVKALTPFDELQDAGFSEDELLGQKIYDEVYFLEVQQLLSDFVQQFYQENKDVEFLEEVNIYYSINQISNEQLDSLHETLMAKVNYYQMNIAEVLFDLVRNPDGADNSFIKLREKKSNNSTIVWTALTVLSVVAVVGVLYLQMSKDIEEERVVEVVKPAKVEKKEAVKKEPKKEIKKVIAKFPDHLEHNTWMIKDAMMLFDVVPYDAILKEIQIDANSSTFVCSFLASSTSNENMKDTLSKIYGESKAILTHSNNTIVNTIITNKGILKAPVSPKPKEYQEHQFMSIAKVTEYIQKTSLKGSLIKYKSKTKDKYTTYRYTLTSLVNEPAQFFNYINELNKKSIPLTVQYPFEFAKTNEGLSIKYDIEFHQQNKPSVKPKN